MKKHPILCLILASVLTLSLLPSAARGADIPETTAETEPQTTNAPAVSTGGGDTSVSGGSHSLDAQVPLGGTSEKPKSARSALLYERKTDTLLYAYDPDRKSYPASLVKVMTGLLAVESGNLDRQVTVTEEALSGVASNSLSVDLKAGETLTMRDLLYCMMMESANDACAVIAVEVAGSRDAFVEQMNRRAAALGCTGTQFVNVDGMEDPQQYTTARDMARILNAALDNEEFVSAFGAMTYTIPATSQSEERVLESSNYLMTQAIGGIYLHDDRVTGGKSGAISNEDRSLVCTATDGSLDLICVIMSAVGQTDTDGFSLKYLGNYEEAETLLDHGFSRFSVREIISAGQSLVQIPVTNGANAVAGGSAASVSTVLPTETKSAELRWSYTVPDSLTAPVSAGASLGSAQVWLGSTCVAQTEILAMNGAAVDDRTLTASAESSAEPAALPKGLRTVLLVILAAAVLFVLGLVALRQIRLMQIRARRRRRRENRRRSR